MMEDKNNDELRDFQEIDDLNELTSLQKKVLRLTGDKL